MFPSFKDSTTGSDSGEVWDQTNVEMFHYLVSIYEWSIFYV